MKKLGFISIIVAIFMLSSCASILMGGVAKVPEQNRSFQAETDVNMTVLSRALFSFSNKFEEEYHKNIYESYMDGRVLFYYDETQAEKAVYELTDEIWSVTINSEFIGYDSSSKWMYMTLILGTIAQLESEGLKSSDEARERFFESPKDWSSDFTSLYGAEWFREKELDFADGAIQ